MAAICFLTNTVNAKSNLHAHSHGAGSLSVVFDGNMGLVEFKAAAEGVLGFEHQPKSKKDKEIYAAVSEMFSNKPEQFIQFAENAKCSFSKESLELTKTKHADFIVRYKVNCQSGLAATLLKIDFSSIKGLKDIDGTVMINDLQKSFEYKGKPVQIELK